MAKQRPGSSSSCWRRSATRGPVTLGELEHLGDANKRRKAAPGTCGTGRDAKKGVEWLFWRGDVPRCGTPQRSSASTSSRARAPPAVVRGADAADDEAMKALLLRRGARARVSRRPATSPTTTGSHRPTPSGWSRELADDGALRPVAVEGWRQPAFLHPDAQLPRWVARAALLSPFDSLVWERDRARAPLRLPLPHRDLRAGAQARVRLLRAPVPPRRRLVARVDLKADRQAGSLLVHAAHAEPTLDADRYAAPARDRLRRWPGSWACPTSGRGPTAT